MIEYGGGYALCLLTVAVNDSHPRAGGGGGVFFFKQKAAYEIRPRAWSSDVCSSNPHFLEINVC